MAENKAKAAVPYIRRMLEDEYFQEQLRSAVGNARMAYQRARKQPAQAPQDKALHRNLRQAATAVRNAKLALKPAPPPPKRRGRKLAVAALAAGATALVTIKLQQQERERAGP